MGRRASDKAWINEGETSAQRGRDYSMKFAENAEPHNVVTTSEVNSKEQPRE